MLEIIILVLLCWHIGTKVRGKGLATFPYRARLVGYWFLGEIVGFIVFLFLDWGLHMSRGSDLIAALVCAYGGAAIGAWAAYSQANNAKSVLELQTELPEESPEEPLAELVEPGFRSTSWATWA